MVKRIVVALISIGLISVAPARLVAQPEPTAEQVALGDAISDRYDVVLLSEGLGLEPRDEAIGVRMIELRGGTIAIDGLAVTGQELRERLGDDADLVLRLTYLDTATRLGLFGVRSLDEPGVSEQAGAVDRPRPDEDQDAQVEPEPAPPRRTRRTGRSDIVQFAGTATVDVDERVRGDVVVIAGSATVDGQVDGDVVVVGGSARFGPEAYVRGEVTVVGGTVSRASTAEFRRGINHVGFGEYDLNDAFSGFSWPRVGFSPRGFMVWDLAGTVLRLIFLALLGCVVIFMAQGSVERVAARSAAEPLKAGFVGFLAQIVFFPILCVAIVLLVISIVGIPLLVLLPFALLAIVIVMFVGFTGVVHGVGRWFSERMGRRSHALYLSIWVGVALLLIPTMVGEALDLLGDMFGFFAVMLALTGLFVEYAAWTTGLGAVILNRFGGALPQPAGGAPLGTEPPPIPSAPPVSEAQPPIFDSASEPGIDPGADPAGESSLDRS